MKNIKGILIDSARVLNMSVTGGFSITPKFFEIVDKERFFKISNERRKKAYEKAWNYVYSFPIFRDLRDELKIFSHFFIIISEELPELNMQDKIEELTDDMVLNRSKFEFFNDVLKIIPELKEKYKICIISDSWPSLREVYEEMNILRYFDDLVISTEIGTGKHSRDMYLTALASLDLSKEEVIFVGSDVFNCECAESAGIKSIVLNRHGDERQSSIRGYKVVKNLYELKELLV